MALNDDAVTFEPTNPDLIDNLYFRDDVIPDSRETKAFASLPPQNAQYKRSIRDELKIRIYSNRCIITDSVERITMSTVMCIVGSLLCM